MASDGKELEKSLFFKSPEKDTLFNSNDDNVLIIPVRHTCGIVVLMNHPASITLYKYVSIRVFSGSVSVMGYEIKPSKDVKLFSSEKSGLIEMKTETFVDIWRTTSISEKLQQTMSRVINKPKLVKEILSRFGNNTVAVYVERQPLPTNIECLELYYPHMVHFGLFRYKHPKDMLYVPKTIDHMPMQFSFEEAKLANEISVMIRSAILKLGEAPRIIVCGPRNVGKSTLLRFLVNRALCVCPAVCYLDTDPGQPEFTPASVVSLTKVEKPIFGPPFMQQRKPAHMIFTGSISPKYFEEYRASVYKLVHLYNEDASLKKFPLFVNTMGWMEGTGLRCLIETINAVQPTALVEMVSGDETSMFDYREYLPDSSQYFQICRTQTTKPNITAVEMREMSLVSHLGKSRFDYMTPMLLNEVTPYSVHWKKIPIYVYPERSVAPTRLVRAINGSVVALCKVPESSIVESEIPEFQMTLKDNHADNECLAFGLVRAIDETKQFLYIVTPLKEVALKNVNALMKGDLMLPKVVITKQEITDVPLPFTAIRNFIEDDDDEEMFDTSMVSLNHSIEDNSAKFSKGHDSAKHFRKAIPYRYGHKKQKH